ncbi:MAG: hypothetical protein JNJ46_23685 [Myxococcales bacterium]|nr:hypothetical protein [Myxococcales bacterium]
MLRKNGFGAHALVEQLRQDMEEDFEKRLKKLKKKEKKQKDEQHETLRRFSTLEAWSQLTQIQQSSEARIQGMAQFVEQTGPNAGKIVIPTTWDAKAQALLGRVLDNWLASEVDNQNALSALKSIDLWTILIGDLGGGFGDSMFGQIFAFRLLSGQGLVRSPMFPGLSGNVGMPGLLLPRVFSLALTSLSGS